MCCVLSTACNVCLVNVIGLYNKLWCVLMRNWSCWLEMSPLQSQDRQIQWSESLNHRLTLKCVWLFLTRAIAKLNFADWPRPVNYFFVLKCMSVLWKILRWCACDSIFDRCARSNFCDKKLTTDQHPLENIKPSLNVLVKLGPYGMAKVRAKMKLMRRNENIIYSRSKR